MTAGLDSAVLGESEIQGQVKQAWDRARGEGAAGPALNLLLRHALEGGKRARTETGIGRKVASVSQAAVAMARERLGGLAGKTVLLLGAGDMGEGMAVALAGAGERINLMVANRTQAKAVALAARIGGRARGARRRARPGRRRRPAAHVDGLAGRHHRAVRPGAGRAWA